ncbi:hypothetical protein DFR52_1011285 [Hoeflea marina]|uniref:Uncharacterized protein n=1 Tax=Hoeflea marina TaxID=274592 RepID=A0A317PWC5_9HYPH|nr:hypothetical protein DFR52_1011285 [Hoeflea marina]
MRVARRTKPCEPDRNNVGARAFVDHLHTGDFGMLKFIGGTVGFIFLVGLLVIVGILMLIF